IFLKSSVAIRPDNIQDPSDPLSGLPDVESFSNSGSEHFAHPAPNMGASSYDGSSRGERQVDSKPV
ncbi:hypothetical protein N0V83_000690, partial [Neocucurbitaria cava]